jgi:hypothetical protein
LVAIAGEPTPSKENLMSARLSRHALTAGAATCAIALATAAPGIARPGGHPPPRAAHDARADPSIATGSLAGTTEANPGVPASSQHARLTAPDDGATTLAVVLIAGGALFAGAGAGFAGGRRAVLRMH